MFTNVASVHFLKVYDNPLNESPISKPLHRGIKVEYGIETSNHTTLILPVPAYVYGCLHMYSFRA